MADPEVEMVERGHPTAEDETSSLLPVLPESGAPPGWRDQLTPRALAASFVLASMFSLVVIRLNLTTGVVPSLNASAGLLGFFLVKSWTTVLGRVGVNTRAFTRQENTVIQTCVVAASGIAFSGGFGSYLSGMSETIAKQTTELNDAQNIKNPRIGWMVGFLFIVSFLGLFSLVPLTKTMIIDYRLIYPSGTATAHLINSLHTPQGAELAKKQVKTLGKFFSLSIFWGFFQWFYIAGEGCGFMNFPTFGLTAYKNKFYFDFSATYVGVGMICPYIVNMSVLLGAIISWGIMWPLIAQKKGSWYAADLSESSLHGLQGYKVFIAIALILGDGLYNLSKIAFHTTASFLQHYHYKLTTTATNLPVSNNSITTPSVEELQNDLFLRDQIPKPVALAGYVAIGTLSTTILPHIFQPLQWYHIVVIYAIAPVLAFCNAYGAGLTDWSLASTYGKLAIFAVGAWAGASHGGVLAGLAACGVIMSIISTASDLMQDFKTGYITLCSPRSMFLAQVAGTAMGCIISPALFLLFYTAFPDLGHPSSNYPSPYALIYRNMALLGVEGFRSLPSHCLDLCYVFFLVAILVNLFRDLVGEKITRFVPIPMAMAIPFYLGSYFAIDMCVGSLIMYVWGSLDREGRDELATAVASGMVCGDGVWALPESLFALAGVQPPICMKFLSREENERVDQLLRT